MNYYPRYVADYTAKTIHLSMEQDGAYTRLLDWSYANERPIPHDRRYTIARAMKASERKAVDDMLAEFFTRTDEGWVNQRAVKELIAAAPKIEAARRNGKLGGRPPKEKPTGFSENNPLGFQSETHGVSNPKAPQNQKEQKQKPCPAGAGRFAEFWSVYPKPAGKKKALEVWRRKRLDGQADALIADVVKRKASHRPWLDGYIPHAERYLRDERWEDAIESGERGNVSMLHAGGAVL